MVISYIYKCKQYKWKREDGKIFIDVQKHRIWELGNILHKHTEEMEIGQVIITFNTGKCILKIHIFNSTQYKILHNFIAHSSQTINKGVL